AHPECSKCKTPVGFDSHKDDAQRQMVSGFKCGGSSVTNAGLVLSSTVGFPPTSGVSNPPLRSNIPKPEQCGTSATPAKYDYSFRAISKQQAKAIIIEHHYKQRPCPISWAY